MKSKTDKLRAARALAQNQSKAAAGRAGGVNRATITRWLDDAEFQDMILEEREKLAEPEPTDQVATKGLADLVPQAIALLEEALSGGNVPAARARIALDVVAKAATMSGGASGGDAVGERSLASIVEALDARGVGSD